MKKLLSIFLALNLFIAAHAQQHDSWKIMLNNKVILQGKNEEDVVTAHLKASTYKLYDKLVINYLTSNNDTAWSRTFFINDSNDNNLFTLALNKQSGSVIIKNNRVKNIINKKVSLSIYTLSTPKDPALAARVRIARVLLGKIEWN